MLKGTDDIRPSFGWDETNGHRMFFFFWKDLVAVGRTKGCASCRVVQMSDGPTHGGVHSRWARGVLDLGKSRAKSLLWFFSFAEMLRISGSRLFLAATRPPTTASSHTGATNTITRSDESVLDAVCVVVRLGWNNKSCLAGRLYKTSEQGDNRHFSCRPKKE